MKPKRILPLSLLHTFTTSLVKGVFVFAAMRRFSRVFVALILLALPLFFLTRANTHVPTAYAATSDNLNFQARLQTSTGAIVPDGFYNVEFKLYDASSGGTLLWTETRYDSNGVTAGNDNRVRVVNGYLTVNLGDITAFPGTMPWDQQMYLTMNIGGTTHTATPTYDGEMSPRLKLTAVPYAFNAKTASELVKTNGALSSVLSIQAPTVGSQTFVIQDQGAAGTYNLLTENQIDAGYIQLQGSTPGTAQTGNFNISGTGIANVLQGTTSIQTPTLDTSSAVALNIGTTNATQINLNQSTVLAAGESITITGGNTASRPGSPTDGMVYYDTTTKRLLVYNSDTAKWQADRSTSTKIVAASNSTQAVKDSADFVADGEAAVGVGTIDGDQIEINAAIAALPASGGSIYLAEGTYRLDGSIVLPSNVKLSGAGSATVVSVNNSFGSAITFVTNSDTTNGNSNITIRDILFDGNRPNNGSTAMHAVNFTQVGLGTGASALSGATITNNVFSNIYGDMVTFNTSYNNRIVNNAFISSGNDAIRFITGASNVVADNTFSGVNQAIEFDNNDNSIISNNSIDGTSDVDGSISIEAGTSGTMVSGNSFKNNTDMSLRIATSSDNTISNNVFTDNGGSGAVVALSVQGNSNDNVISNNTFRDTAGSGYAIDIESAAADRTVLEGNSLRGTGANTINDIGTGTIYGGQINSSTNYVIQPAGTIELMKNTSITGTISGTSSLTLGTSSTTNGTIVFRNSTNANTVTLQSAAQTGSYTLSIPVLSGNADICTSLNNCNSLTTTSGIQNQNASQQTSSNYWISGTGRADTSITTPLLDTATAVALNIGTTNATQINLNQSTVLAAGESLTLTGGNTASRPGSPTDGMVYYDTTTKQLLVYNSGTAKWQADSKAATFIVAASNSSQATKDGAQYVANGEDSAGAGIGTLDGDQIEINNALTAAAAAGGGTVYLAEGTYTIDASISIPNNVTLAGSGNSTLIQLGNFGFTSVNINAVVNTDVATGTGIGIRDLKIDGRASNQNWAGTQTGIYLDNMGGGSGSSARNGAKLTNLTVSRFLNYGVQLNASSNNIITGSTAFNSNVGFFLVSSSNNTVTGNTSQGNTSTGFYLSTSSTNNTITGNTAQGNTIYGIYLNSSSNNTITGNTTQAGSYGIYLTTSDYNTVTGNTAQGNTIYGIFLNTATYNTVTGNTVQGTTTYGISLSSSSNYNTIAGNTVHNTGGATTNNGIYLNASDSNTISSNTITDTSCSSNCYAVNIFNSTSDNNYLAGNVFSTTSGTATINDAGTGTRYAGQAMTQGGLDIRFKQPNSASAFNVQNGTGTAVLNVDTSTNTVQVAGAFTSSGGAVNINASSNFAVNIATGTSTGAVSIGNSANTTTLGSNTINLGTTGASTTVQGATQGTLNTAGNGLTAQGSTGNGTGAGGTLTIRGGTGGATNANGGNVVISGGTATGTGTQGLVTFSTSAFTSATTQSFGATGNLTAGLVDQYSTVPVSATATGVTVTIPAPAVINQVVGRILYLANVGANDFNILLTGTSINISLKPNSTATLIWNGTGWTAAGASSSTDLQSAYNNTLTSAGGAELVLNPAGGAADGLTIRNNGTTPISGGLLEVQSSIGTNLFSVNGYGTELVANGGAETKGASDLTFPASTWTAQAASTVSRTITSGEFQTGQAGVKVVTTAINQGVRNQLTTNPVASTYTVSFTAASSTAGTGTTPIEVIYSPDGGTTLTNLCQGFGNGFTTSRTISNNTTVNWTKVTCTLTATVPSGTPLLIIRQTDGTARTLYIDNLSMIRNDATTRPASVQIGGGNTGGQVTLFTFDRSSSAPLVSGSDDRYLGSMYYDTTLGNIQCYESDGWGACGSAPDNIVTLTPEYSNAVLGAPGTLGGTFTATGVGTLTADFCSNQSTVLQVNTSFCATGISRNYYRWTSPQATAQTYSVYVSYKLPSTFKTFYDDNTIKLTGLRDHATNSTAALSVFRSTGSAVSQCGSTTTVTTSTGAWTTSSLTGNETGCGFVAGDIVLFKIDVTAQSNANVYIENLEFRYTNK